FRHKMRSNNSVLCRFFWIVEKTVSTPLGESGQHFLRQYLATLGRSIVYEEVHGVATNRRLMIGARDLDRV
ncbi:hypothetical protein L9F63_003530, partial [Diploptera punctata]